MPTADRSAAAQQSAALQVLAAKEEDAAAWDEYVMRCPAASNYHQWAWKVVIGRAFGHSAHYLMALQDGKIQGVLPAIAMKSLLFGHFLVSLPFFNYGGILASTPEARQALLASGDQLCRDLKVGHLELRQGHAADLGWPESTAKVAMVVRLPKTADELMKGLSSRLRNKIRHAQKHGLQIVWGGAELLPEFYSVFCINMRNLGTPVYPYRWFENVCRQFPGIRLLVVRDGKIPVAATLITVFRDFVELPWIASTPEARKHYSTVLLYWTALEWAIQSGYAEVDLGRCTPHGGTYQFKQQWNCEERPLHWYYWLPPGAAIPELRPSNPKYQLAIRAWQKLPLAVANFLGPHIVRNIP